MSTALWSWLQADPYLFLFPLMVLEGPLSTMLAGTLVTTGAVTFPLVGALAVAAELTADTAFFALGRLSRGPRVHALLSRSGLTAARRAVLEVAVTRNLPGLLLGAKVADGAAIPVIVAAGASGIGYARFLAWSGALSIPKVVLLVTVGAVFGAQATELLSPSTTALLALATVVVLLTITTRHRHRRRHRPSPSPSHLTGIRTSATSTPRLQGALL